MDRLAEVNETLQSDNDSLREELKQCKNQNNDLEQYGRRWNLKVFNVEDNLSETAAHYVKSVKRFYKHCWSSSNWK